jgi:hypothetical protein
MTLDDPQLQDIELMSYFDIYINSIIEAEN